MTAADLLVNLTDLGIVLESVGNQLRFYPRSAVTPELTRKMKAHKIELLRILGDQVGSAGVRCPRCHSNQFTYIKIHEGRSLRRECRGCGRFIDFPLWYGGTFGAPGRAEPKA